MSKKRPMVRKQLYIEPEQNTMLREQAGMYDVSEGQIVREAITAYLKTGFQPQEVDLDAWEEERQFIASRLGDSKGATKRAWTRGELYDL